MSASVLRAVCSCGQTAVDVPAEAWGMFVCHCSMRPAAHRSATHAHGAPWVAVPRVDVSACSSLVVTRSSPCALVSGSKTEAATVSRLTQSGRHDRVHSDPPAASHPRTGGRRRSRRVATPLRGTISTCGFGLAIGSCLLSQDYATAARRLAVARTARSKGDAGDLANV